MKNYTKTYMQHFGYDTSDFIPCEVCEAKAVDIHHIWARSIKDDLVNDITNIQALCRVCHQTYGDKKQHREMLQKIHDKRLNKLKC